MRSEKVNMERVVARVPADLIMCWCWCHAAATGYV